MKLCALCKHCERYEDGRIAPSCSVAAKPWGETRYTSGTTLTTFKYTGQRQDS